MEVTGNGFLFFIVFSVFSASSSARVFFNGKVSAQYAALMDRCGSGRVYPASSDSDIHLSKHGNKQHLVYRAPGSNDPRLFHGRKQNQALATKA